MWKTLASLFGVFAPLSFFCVGGGQAILADVQRQVIDVHHWLTRTEFADIYAISRMAPGPGSLYITLIGWHIAGFYGALAATVGIFAPSTIAVYLIAGFWSRFKASPWLIAIETGLKPVAAALVMSGVYVLLTTMAGAPWAQILALSCTALLLAVRINPLILISMGSLFFVTAHSWHLL
jgi:chromate transporter